MIEEEDVIVVVGAGVAEVAPDRVRAVIGASCVAATVAEALTAVATAQERILGIVLGAGIDRSSVQTLGYHVGPDFDARGPSDRHRADVTLAVVLDDIVGAATLLAAMSEAVGDAFRVNGVTPESSDLEPGRRVAREAAVGAARRQAEELAAAAGVRLGRLRSLAEGSGPTVRPWGGGPAMMAATTSAPSVEGGGLGVRVEVTATYEILQE